MITYFRTPGCEDCDKICELLEKLPLSHHVVPILPYSYRALGWPLKPSPPALLTDGRIVEGHEAIRTHIRELKQFAPHQRQQQFPRKTAPDTNPLPVAG